MLDPLGPLPEAIYWRRRALALAVLVVVLLVGVVAVSAFGKRGDAVNPAASSGSSVPPPSTSAPSSVTSTRPPPPPDKTLVRATPPPPPVPPAPCPDQALIVTAQPGKPSFGRGERPELRLVVANVGPVACTRDLGTSLQEATVTGADGTRVWSSRDCFTGGSEAVRTLLPREEVILVFSWGGERSAPGCVPGLEPVLVGEYRLTAALGPLGSAPVPFSLTA